MIHKLLKVILRLKILSNDYSKSQTVKDLNGFVQIKDTFNKAPYQKDIIINYKEPLTFKQINEVLQFETDGSEYIDYC